MQDFLPLITGSAGALVVLALWVYGYFVGKIHPDSEFQKLEAERDYWRDAYTSQVQATQTERKTLNETAQAGTVTNQLITALTQLAENRRPIPPPAPPHRPAPALELTGEDLGL